MAIWQFQFTTLEITGYDNNGWPITELVNRQTMIEENSMLRLWKSAKQEIQVDFPDACSIAITSYDRVDKRTGKTYEGFDDDPARLQCSLNPEQHAALQRLQGNIFAKALGDNRPIDGMEMLFGPSITISTLTEGVACLRNYGAICNHDEAKEIILSLENFYSRISPNELAVLLIQGNGLTQGELELVRSFNVPVRG